MTAFHNGPESGESIETGATSSLSLEIRAALNSGYSPFDRVWDSLLQRLGEAQQADVFADLQASGRHDSARANHPYFSAALGDLTPSEIGLLGTVIDRRCECQEVSGARDHIRGAVSDWLQSLQ